MFPSLVPLGEVFFVPLSPNAGVSRLCRFSPECVAATPFEAMEAYPTATRQNVAGRRKPCVAVTAQAMTRRRPGAA